MGTKDINIRKSDEKRGNIVIQSHNKTIKAIYQLDYNGNIAKGEETSTARGSSGYSLMKRIIW